MILFLKDWAKYPGAILDTATTNRSWVELAIKFKRAGYRNYHFFLALHNPQLLGVDPHSPDLTTEQMAMIAIECTQNPWYVLRNVLKAPPLSGEDGVPITANRANISLWWSFFNHIQYLLVQPRQTGKSFSTDALMVTLMNFVCNNTQINLLTKDDTLRQANIARIRKIYDELPAYLQFRGRGDTVNSENFTVSRRSNVYYAHVPRAAEKDAYKLGRGLSSPIFQIDEGPFQPHIGKAAGSAIAAMGAAMEQAIAKGEPSGVIWTTTAGKQDDDSGKYVYNLAITAAVWSEHFYDAVDHEDLVRMVRKNAKTSPSGEGYLRIYGNFSHRQMGKTDEWLNMMLQETNQSPDDANRDFFGVWTAGSSNSPLSITILDTLKRSVKDIVYQELCRPYQYILRWYIEQHKINEYMAENVCTIGLDTSDAAGNDDITMVVRNCETGEVVAAGDFNELNLIEFTKFLLSFMLKYCNTVLVPERRSSAITIIDYLIIHMVERNIDPFKRIFNWVVSEPEENKTLYDQIKGPMSMRQRDIYVRAKSLFGYATAGSGKSSRDNLYGDALQHAMKHFSTKVNDSRLIEQILGLVIRNNRIDHAEGKHDDMVISYLLTHWFLTRTKNLADYGINPLKVLRIDDQQIATNVAIEQKYSQFEQNQIRTQIEMIMAELKKSSDLLVVNRLENRLKALYTRLVVREGETLSIDAVIQNLREQRKLNRILSR
jgi:L-rhamnose mutarotase